VLDKSIFISYADIVKFRPSFLLEQYYFNLCSTAGGDDLDGFGNSNNNHIFYS